MKICKICGIEKNDDEFSTYKADTKKGYYTLKVCKDCERARKRKLAKKWYEKNKEKKHAFLKKYRETHKEYFKEWHRKHYQENKDEILRKSKEYRENNKEKMKIKDAESYQRNKAKINEYRMMKRHTDELYLFKKHIRNFIYNSFKRTSTSKDKKTQEILGCDFETFRQHLLKTFKNNYGYEWDGEPVHIDHIIPLAQAKNREDTIKLCHYKNLQLLKPQDNMLKSDKLDYQILK